METYPVPSDPVPHAAAGPKVGVRSGQLDDDSLNAGNPLQSSDASSAHDKRELRGCFRSMTLQRMGEEEQEDKERISEANEDTDAEEKPPLPRSPSSSQITGPICAREGDWNPSQMLHAQSIVSFSKISTFEARQRNYLVGSCGPAGRSLFGAEELENLFPNRTLSIYVGSFNMAGNDVTHEDVKEWLLPEDVPYTADIYVIGIQEAPAHESMNDYRGWERKLQDCLLPCKQVRLYSVWFGVQHLAVFVRRELIWYISELKPFVKSTRVASKIKTKGAICLFFRCFGTKMLFISSHFSHGPDPTNRINDYFRITESLSMNKHLTKNHGDVFDTSDLVVWFGDLNFRLFMDPVVMKSLANPESDLVDKVLQSQLQQFDQLKRLIQKDFIFPGFTEASIKFPPTYKFEIGFDRYDVRKQRFPAFTDRILYKVKENDGLECVAYNCVRKVRTSDHKPVYAMLHVKLRPGVDLNVHRRSSVYAPLKGKIILSGTSAAPTTVSTTNRTKSQVCNIT